MDLRAARRDDQILRRIMMTLVALAVLAERAGGRSYPVRCLVLWFLRHAEFVAREFVADIMPSQELAFDDDTEFDNDPIDAIGLAIRFRMLAAILATFICLAAPSDFWTVRIDGASRRFAAKLGQLVTIFAASELRLNDTS